MSSAATPDPSASVTEGTTMKAMLLASHGGPECLSWGEIPRPDPAPGEVRVRVRAVAMNHMDLWVRRGGPAFKVTLLPAQ